MFSIVLALWLPHSAQAGEYLYSDDAFEIADLVVEGVVQRARCISYYQSDDADSVVMTEAGYMAGIDVREIHKGQAPTNLKVAFRDVEIESNDNNMGCGYLPEATLAAGWAGVLYLEEAEDGSFVQVDASWPDSSADSDPGHLPDCADAAGWDATDDQPSGNYHEASSDADLVAGCQVVSASTGGWFFVAGLFGLIGRRR